jgi:protocatechuate 3,4-dioxygenase, alpha subunit
MSEVATPSQTVGPFFHIGLEHIVVSDLTAGVDAEHLEISCRVLDGDGRPVNDALVELWQADVTGNYIQSNSSPTSFNGFGRVATDANGAFRFITVKPGRVPGLDSRLQAPHVAVNVFMRGLLKHLVTRIYFPDEPSNAGDRILNLVPPARRPTLIANAVNGARNQLMWDIVLQGERETVFFDC